MTKPAKTAPPSPSTGGLECRRWTRLVPEVRDVTLYTHHGKQAGLLVDESFGGIGVVLQERPDTEVGQDVTVMYYGAPMRGLVRRIAQEENAGWNVGVQWVSRDYKPQAAPSSVEPE